MELVTGATGYVGSRLVRRLVADGRPVRALARRPELVTDIEVVRGDLLTGSGLEQALEGCSAAYYLIHSMEPATDNGTFAGRDRQMATAFAEAAAHAGVERIVYLGGIVPAQDASGQDAAGLDEGESDEGESPAARRVSPHPRL